MTSIDAHLPVLQVVIPLLVASGAGSDSQLVRHLLGADRERVVAANFHSVRDVFEQPCVVVENLGGFAMHYAMVAHYFRSGKFS